MNDLIRMKMIETIENLFGNETDPFFFQSVAFAGFNQIGDRTSTTVLHDQLPFNEAHTLGSTRHSTRLSPTQSWSWSFLPATDLLMNAP